MVLCFLIVLVLKSLKGLFFIVRKLARTCMPAIAYSNGANMAPRVVSNRQFIVRGTHIYVGATKFRFLASQIQGFARLIE